ncbi:MAG: tetratricopeptide repeat protein [Proteobacteria bacterium]|nr:tetratricopeptide repeat protein [Pseudomonadota bacterium]MCH8098564.1 tetratricopeptide repeat protein [Pseudomonadota bacterium]
MLSKSLLAVLLSVALAASAYAAGSSSSSSRPSPPSTFDLGEKAVKAKDFERALSLLKKVVRSDPGNADAWNYIGFSHRKLDQLDRALPAYQKALAIDPDHRGANEYLGELYLATGNLEKARERLKKLDAICTFGCEEYDDLKRAVKTYEDRRKKG